MSLEKIFSLAGKNAIITGGHSGLGLAMTEALVMAGAKVAAIGRSATAESLAHLGDKVKYYSFDITDTDNAPALVDQVRKDFGSVDILVNNAGIHCKKPIEEMSVGDFEAVLQTHMVAAFALTKAVVPMMKTQKHGNILFIASMTSFIGQPFVTGYSAAKSGYLGMVHTLASELATSGIRVNAIAPGWIDSPMLRQVLHDDPAREAKILNRIPMGKTGNAEDIGYAAIYLCSEAAKYVSGICLPVDGGALIGF